jgi:hypothetical protein
VTANGADDGRCPRCGEGTLVDISFDLHPADPVADGMQEAESRQIETYSCGHTVVGPRLSSADQEAMTVERRTSDEATMPAPTEEQGDPVDGPHISPSGTTQP